MMDVIGETCKLCLKYIQGTNLAVLDETLLGKLEFLQMNLDQSVEESNSVCKECEEKIEHAFDFKSCLVNTESCLVPYVSEDKMQKVNLKVVVEKDSPSTSVGESSAEKEVCRLCKNFVNVMSVISLPKILKDDSMMEIFQGHIPEMDLDVTENPVVCDTCQKSLASFSTLIASWSIANGWNEDDDEDMKEQLGNYEVIQMKKEDVDLTDSNTNSSASFMDVSGSATNNKNRSKTVKVKSEVGEISDSSEGVSSFNIDIKKEKEECEDENDESMDVQLKNEEVDIKPEDEDGTNASINVFSKAYKAYVDQIKSLAYANDIAPPFNCKNCNYKAKNKKTLINHLIVRNHLQQLTKTTGAGIPLPPHKCSKCQFQGKNSVSLAHHMIVHKRPERPSFYKCDECNYQSKHRYTLRRHQLVHKDPNEIGTYKCTVCPYQSIHKQSLKDHSLIHKDVSEVRMFTCHLCPYQAKHKLYLRYHRQRIHKLDLHLRQQATQNLDKIYNCVHCSFETNKRNTLVKHMLVHRKMDEVPTFKCTECPYESKYKSSLNRHIRTHRSYDEVVSFQCTECAFRSKCQRNMRKHMALHQRCDDGKVCKCKYCSYSSRSMGSLASHVKRIHMEEYYEERRKFEKITTN